jgi:hypothetical protein
LTEGGSVAENLQDATRLAVPEKSDNPSLIAAIVPTIGGQAYCWYLCGLRQGATHPGNLEWSEFKNFCLPIAFFLL